ncbi:unnamed protein product [Brassica oleracea var. botrytis]|uniref:(rape) hypothetical protein n=1 Tax=Brassica napus TaxID=3708 RepID=A0A816QSZ2_BRANA|nr:unnamed protein product [Brassica napus]
MVGGCSPLSYSSSSTFIATTTLSSPTSLFPRSFLIQCPLNLRKPAPLRCLSSLTMESPKPILDFEKFDDGFVQKLVYDALVWSSLHGLVVGDKNLSEIRNPGENDFFKVFGPAFKRNARWSVNTRVPDLGDENTPVKEVDSYYNFWYAFKSWREFPEEEEHDLEEADSREEKRWMERENARKTQKARKEEYARIRTLVDNAYKKDPRIVKRKEEEKAKKQAKKDEKVMAKKKLEEEAAAAIEEEKRRKEEEAKLAAEAAQQQKKKQGEGEEASTLSAPVLSQRLLGISVAYVEDLCMSLNTEQLRKLCDKMENKEGLKLANVLKNGNNDETESEEEEVVEAKQNGHVEANGFATQSP